MHRISSTLAIVLVGSACAARFSPRPLETRYQALPEASRPAPPPTPPAPRAKQDAASARAPRPRPERVKVQILGRDIVLDGKVVDTIPAEPPQYDSKALAELALAWDRRLPAHVRAGVLSTTLKARYPALRGLVSSTPPAAGYDSSRVAAARALTEAVITALARGDLAGVRAAAKGCARAVAAPSSAGSSSEGWRLSSGPAEQGPWWPR
jgi:hypothetical protein